MSCCLPTACTPNPGCCCFASQGYLPRDLYDLNSKFGTEAELRDAISVFHEQVRSGRCQGSRLAAVAASCARLWSCVDATVVFHEQVTCCAVLRCAVLRCAALCCAVLCCVVYPITALCLTQATRRQRLSRPAALRSMPSHNLHVSHALPTPQGIKLVAGSTRH